MNLKNLLLPLCLISLSLKAEYPYETFNGNYNQDNLSYEVSNMPATKSQDGIGLCYGFSSTTLLENYRCRTLKISCLNKEESLSPIDVSSYYLGPNSKKLKEGGFSYDILKNIKNSPRKIVKESCIPYNSLVKKGNPQFVPNEGEGWKYLNKIWNALKNQKRPISEDQIMCTAQTIKTEVKGLLTSTSQIAEAMKTANSLENFLYKTIVPNECLNDVNKMAIPDFEPKSFPEYSATGITPSILADKIESILLNNIPVEIGICTELDSNGKCKPDQGHSITLFAIKEACNPLQECRRMVRVKNSYGWGWQRDNQDGWVDLVTLAKASRDLNTSQNITWIQAPGTQLQNKKLERKGYDVESSKLHEPSPKTDKGKAVPDKYKGFVGIFKCPNNTYLDHYEEGCVPYLNMKN